MVLKKLTADNIFFAKCLFYYFKVLGLAPMTLCTKLTKTHCVAFTLSKRALIYNVILISILAISNVYRIMYLCYLGAANEFEAVTNCLQDVFVCFTAVFVLTKICFSREKMIAIVNALSKHTEVLDSFGVKNPKKHKLHLEIGSILLINVTLWIILFIVTAMANVTYLLYNSIMYSNVFLVNALLIQYSVILKFLQQNFKMLNENLSEYSQEETIKIQTTIESKRNVERLLQLRKLHASMSEVSQDVSNYYSYPTLSCIVYVFYTLILTCYFLARPIVLHESSFKGFMFLMFFIYAILLAFSVVLLTKCVTAAIDESNRTKMIINASLLNFEDDEKMSKKLSQFSCYLLHTDIKFKVSGLLSLDDSLLTAMAGSITTYMVIVFQFLQK